MLPAINASRQRKAKSLSQRETPLWGSLWVGLVRKHLDQLAMLSQAAQQTPLSCVGSTEGYIATALALLWTAEWGLVSLLACQPQA